MPRAIWRDQVLADSERTIVVEGNHYFPPETLKWEYLRESHTKTRCWWKGTASYYDVLVGDQVNRDAAWTYPDPSRAASRIKDYVAFWHGVDVVD